MPPLWASQCCHQLRLQRRAELCRQGWPLASTPAQPSALTHGPPCLSNSNHLVPSAARAETSPLRLYLFPSGGWRASQTGIYVLFVCLTLTVLSIDFRCDPSEINISDEMPKTTVWKALSMNSGNTKEKR